MEGADSQQETIPLAGAEAVLNIEVENDGDSANALDGFKLELQDHPGGEFYDYLVSSSAGSGDFGSSLSNLPFVTSTGPHEIGAGAKAHFTARVHAAHKARLKAKSAGNSDVKARGTVLSND
jgi:hypothetical protein